MLVTKTDIKALPLISRGKVRDIYALGDDRLLIVTTDRISAFDVIMGEAVPGKGEILNNLTLFWMRKFEGIIPNHIIESDADKYPEELRPYADVLRGRSVIVRRARNLPVECIVRGYISGSGWKSYKKDGTICGHVLPKGLRESDKLETPIFTPSTKADQGHDENITFERMADLVGRDLAGQMAEKTLAIYSQARDFAAGRNIIIADTKLEFGVVDGKLILIDEVLTPDSSRFWPMEGYEPGRSQPSLDKQFLRDWLEAQPWNKQAPAPAIPEDIIRTTAGKYREIFDILTK